MRSIVSLLIRSIKLIIVSQKSPAIMLRDIRVAWQRDQDPLRGSLQIVHCRSKVIQSCNVLPDLY